MAKKTRSKPRVKSSRSRSAGARLTQAGGLRVNVINMIPRALSAETEQDSEPMIAVDRSDSRKLVGSAFTPDPMGGSQAPIFISSDRGQTWTLNSIVPAGGNITGDIAVASTGGDVRFAFGTTRLYAGILRRDAPPGNTRMAILRADDPASPTPMRILEDRVGPDQPFTQAATVIRGTDAGKDRFYVGNNDFGAPARRTATLDVSLDGGASSPRVKQVRLEKRATGGQDGPQVRPALHTDGTVYAIFYGWRSLTGSFPANTLKITSDIVVVRDDDWGKGSSAFEDLKDPGDGLSGVRVATGVTLGFDRTGSLSNGQQRLGGNLTIAVDPREGQSGTVYVAWNDEPTEGNFAMHVRRSTDRGRTWSAADLLTVNRATNGALAINVDGTVGLLYQQLSGSSSSQRWSTHFRLSSDGGSSWQDVVLADTPAGTPAKQFDPYLGDYAMLRADSRRFYGVFSANNTPNLANFPSGVTYQRNHNFATQKLLRLDGVTEVAVSIDPFFFTVDP